MADEQTPQGSSEQTNALTFHYHTGGNTCPSCGANTCPHCGKALPSAKEPAAWPIWIAPYPAYPYWNPWITISSGSSLPEGWIVTAQQ